MRYFVSENTRNDKPFYEVENGYIKIYIINQDTIEFILEGKDNVYITIYALLRDDNSFFLCSYWEDIFDYVYESDDVDLRMEIIQDTWPVQYSYLYNGFINNYSEGALVRLENEDTGSGDWLLITILNVTDAKYLINSMAPIIRDMDTIESLSWQLYNELASFKEPNWKKWMWKGIKEGAIEGMKKGVIDGFKQFIEGVGVDVINRTKIE